MSSVTIGEPAVRRVEVWDVPTRLFHWSLVILVVVAWLTGEGEGAAAVIHRLAGEADAGLLSAVRLLRVAGQHELADVILGQLVGRSVAEDRWTFEVDETHDDDFFRTLQDVEDRLHARAPTDGPD